MIIQSQKHLNNNTAQNKHKSVSCKVFLLVFRFMWHSCFALMWHLCLFSRAYPSVAYTQAKSDLVNFTEHRLHQTQHKAQLQGCYQEQVSQCAQESQDKNHKLKYTIFKRQSLLHRLFWFQVIFAINHAQNTDCNCTNKTQHKCTNLWCCQTKTTIFSNNPHSCIQNTV